MQSTRPRSSAYLIPLLCFLLLGAVLQFGGLGRMTQMLNYDEAYYSVDALSLLTSPRFEPFFPANQGREGGWMYVLASAFAVSGVQPLVPRIVVMMVSFLTLAAVYRLGRETVGSRAAVWSVAGLAVLYWHVQIGHLALRANLFPLVGATAFAVLFLAYKHNKLGAWALAGVLFGLLVYTYPAGRLWIAYGLLIQAWWLLRERDKRRGVILSLVLASILAVPMLWYTAMHPREALFRISGVATLNTQSITESLRRWAEAWFYRGELYAGHGLPGRPLLDTPLGALFLAGMLGLPWVARRARLAGWVYGLAALSLAPSIFSELPPHQIRAVGTTIPIALALGAGAVLIERGLRKAGPYAAVLPLALFCWAGVNTYRDVQRWLALPDLSPIMEQHVHIGTDYVLGHVSAGTPVYFSPFTPEHPVVSFSKARLDAYPVGAFDGNTCLVISDRPAVYVSVTPFDPALASGLARWADVEVVAEDRAAPSPRYTIYQAAAGQALLSAWGEGASTTFGDRLALRILDPLPDTAHPGDTLPLTLAIRRLQAVDRPYHIFLHLYGNPTPYEGGPLWAQADARMCDSYPAFNWMEHEIVVQTYTLAVPAEIEPGEYTIVLGLYDPDNGIRLPPTSPAGPADYLEAWRLTVGR